MKKVFEVEVDGKKLSLAVKKPDLKAQKEGQQVYNRAFREAVMPADGKPGAIVRAVLDKVLREQKLWDDARQKQLEELQKKLLEAERTLAKGGGKLSEALKIAVDMRLWRAEIRNLLADRNSLDRATADSQAGQAQFDYYVSVCTVYADTNKPYFSSVEDYLNRADEPAVLKIASEFGNIHYGLDEEYASKLPENRFLLKQKLCRSGDLHLIDKQGNLVDAQGRRVDEKGRWINVDGKPVDIHGNPLTEDGEYLFEEQPFIDDLSPPHTDISPAKLVPAVEDKELVTV